MIKSSEIRQQFIDFFKDKNHSYQRGSSVVPNDDPTLLFTNAGMNQFKPIFLNQKSPTKTRLVNSQKCIRVSGKHNDLEEVGVDDYHHTFFEMLGNWSFGDYYKKEAIIWAWELLTDVWKIDKRRLWVSVYEDDEESKNFWLNETDIEKNRILKFGKKENFWEMGESGPCGPCTEIHYYFGDDLSAQDPKGVNYLDEYREIWNLVFIQFNRTKDGKLKELPMKHVDTGMGLERIVGVLNNEQSNYSTDLFTEIIKKIEVLSGIKYHPDKRGIPHRVIADHIRMLSFSISDGAMPSNDGRGYVLRRVLRRASRFCRELNIKNEILYKLVDSVINIMGKTYTELIDKKIHISKVIKAEEESFGKTLDNGLEVFNKIVSNLSSENNQNLTISGSEAFKLYDTYGFPLDLTKLMAKERNILVDENNFNLHMSKQRKRSRSTLDFKLNDSDIKWVNEESLNHSTFEGYSNEELKTHLKNYRNIKDDQYEIIIENTPFYAESGGQVGDTGIIENNSFTFKVIDTQKKESYFSHIGILKRGNFKSNEKVLAKIDSDRRMKIKSNHTATHLLHESLKQILGNHVQQAGSLVSDDKLRFDLTHYEKISDHEIVKIEEIVNENIRKNMKIIISIEDYDTAKKNGAVALFGEKYGDEVRVVDIPGFSMELCGGTHVNRTGDIGMFKIISESSLSSGVRRIEAITGSAVLNRINEMNEIINFSKKILKTSENEINNVINNLITKNKELEKKLKKNKSSNTHIKFDDLMANSKLIKTIKVVVYDLGEYNEDLKVFGDQFRSKSYNRSILILSSTKEDKLNLMCAITDDLLENLNAGYIAKNLGKIINGGGGGKKHIATAGGKNLINKESLYKKIITYINELIE
tara:strand:+ start:3624 stop:6233 length:2610 start_codon:yes stop_codon:yes gene_type:complete